MDNVIDFSEPGKGLGVVVENVLEPSTKESISGQDIKKPPELCKVTRLKVNVLLADIDIRNVSRSATKKGDLDLDYEIEAASNMLQ